MKNSIICKYCNSENPFYNLNCSNCNAYLRDKVPNIDFWKTFWGIIFNPIETFNLIIFAEKKNYVLIFNILNSIAIFFASLIFSNLTINIKDTYAHNFISYNLIFLWFCVFLSINLIYILSYLIFKIYQKFNRFFLRIKDYFTVAIYSNLPIILWSFIIFPISLATLGETLINWYPAPYLYKPLIFYTLLVLSVLFFIYNIVLYAIGIFSLIKRKLIATIMSLIYHALILGVMMYCWILVINLYRY